MKVEKVNPYMNYEDKQGADKYIIHILNCADFFENRIRVKPTVFMSNDVLEIIVRFHREKVIHQIYGEAILICGYDVKITYGKDLLYLGVSITNQM